MAPIVLYHCSPSAPSRSALLGFRNLKIEVNVKHVDLFSKEHLKPEYMEINPQHTVPTIDDNGFILWESRAILGYLVDSKSPGNSLYPADTKQRAIIDQRLYFDAGTLYPRIRAIAFPALFLGEKTISEDKRKQLTAAFELMNTFLEGQNWFAGNNVTIADLSLLASVSSIVYIGADISGYKNLSAWYERCKSLPGYEENNEAAIKYGELVRGKLTDKL